MAMEKKTQFSLACGLLSKMVKEKKQQQGIGFDGCRHPRPPLTTMDLLSGIDVSADDTTETARPQLTIFYDGKMFVFDDVLEERANALMKMAASNESWRPPVATATTTTTTTSSGPGSSIVIPPAKLINHSMNLLAQTRKASLHRFLNRRKERINAKAPYQKTHAEELATNKMIMGARAKPEETRSWLALGHQISELPSLFGCV